MTLKKQAKHHHGRKSDVEGHEMEGPTSEPHEAKGGKQETGEGMYNFMIYNKLLNIYILSKLNYFSQDTRGRPPEECQGPGEAGS